MPDAAMEELLSTLNGAAFAARSSETLHRIKKSITTIGEEDLSEILEALFELYCLREYSGKSDARFLTDLMAFVRHAVGDDVDAQQLSAANDRLKDLLDIESIKDLASRPVFSEDSLREEFTSLADRWQRDTRHLSIVSQKIIHPAYLQIIGMGQPVIPLILGALRDKPAHWFAALRALAKTDPAPEGSNPNAARQAWLNWGKRHGFI